MPDRTWRLAPTLAILASFLALAWAADRAQAYSSKLLRYPYLTDVVGSSATVNWATDTSATTGTIRWGTVESGSCTAKSKAAAKTTITVGATVEYQWKARLTLTPNTEYCYRVYLGSGPEEDLLGEDPSPRFFSQLPSGSAAPFSFAVFGNWGAVDENGDNPDQANLMRQIAASGARFAVTTGDNAYNSGNQTNYGDLVQKGPDTSGVFGPEFWTLAGASIPLFPALGNHGIGTANSHFLNWPQQTAVSSSSGTYVNETYCCLNGTRSARYGSAWYAFDAGNARFYVLQAAWGDTNVGTGTDYQNDYDYHWSPTSDEYRWLESDLAANPSQLKFAFFQYPMYVDNGNRESDPFLQGPASLEGLLTRHGVDIGFSGHAHLYQRNTKAYADGLLTYVTGGGGAKLMPIGNGGGCNPTDAFGIGWSYSANEGLGKGSACGQATRPSSRDQVFHFLKVSVDGTRVTVTPIDSLGRSFDEVTYDFGAQSDLSVTQSDLPDPVPAWHALDYTLTVRNDGLDRATGVMLKDVLPENVTFESVSSSQGRCSHETGTINCALGELESGATATVQIAVIPQSAGAIAATASVYANETDADRDDNTVTEETTVDPATDEVLAFAPSADSSLNSDSPDANFGFRPSLIVDASPARDVLLNFDVSGIGARNVVSAKLRLYCVGAGVTSGGRFQRAADSGWLEQLVTWNTAPAAVGDVLDSLGPVSPGNWYEADVTPVVTGDGSHSVRMSSTSADGADYYSREGPAGFTPQLLVTVR